MSNHSISPERVTKPIQLLAAWLVGLFVTNGSFLLAAQHIDRPAWGSAMLLIAAVVNVPLFIGALFLLQTRFRPQMQEDSYYSRYLDEERRRSTTTAALSSKDFDKEISEATAKIINSIGAAAQGKEQPISSILRDAQADLLMHKHGSTRAIAELYASPETWADVVDRWGDYRGFKKEVDALVSDGLAVKTDGQLDSTRLTDLGKTVAKLAEEKNLLFSQKKPDFWKRRMKHRMKKNDESEDGEPDA